MPKDLNLIQLRVNMTAETRHHLSIIATKEGRTDTMQATVLLREAVSRQMKAEVAAKLPSEQSDNEALAELRLALANKT